ncbi:GntR family transcriptional regulator [Nocardioides solisilvae]|uniref:GntR family transcriptional regulator n=1 Tax=Nocardioides solisilvae TaxID=1542435 RepID=UPI000D744EA0|nr:GntR family transcriptional regulator [Nocardioides solisilvae]
MNEHPVLRVDREAPEPPFEQVRTQLAAGIAAGDLAAGTRLPPVRALAEELGLAVNTVARVYKELEADGLVETRGRNGTVVRSTDGHDGPDTSAAARRATEEFVVACRRLGLGRAEAVRLLEEHWGR